MLFYLFLIEVWHCPLEAKMSNIHLHENRNRYFTSDRGWQNNIQQIIYEQPDREKKTQYMPSKWRCKRLYVPCMCLQSCFFTCRAQNWMCNTSLYTCSWPIWAKIMQVLLQHMSQGNCNFSLCERRFLFFPRHVAPGTESGNSTSKNITAFGEEGKI